jgi:hypothetical protein
MTIEKDKPEIVINRGVSNLSAELEGIILPTEEEMKNGLRAPDDVIAQDNTGGDDEIIAYPAFGARRYKGQEVMVEFRLKNGKRRLLAYTYLVDVQFCPDEGITMIFAGYRVKIEGRNLISIFNRLKRHEVNFVCEKDDFYDTGDKKEVFVSLISVEDKE